MDNIKDLIAKYHVKTVRMIDGSRLITMTGDTRPKDNPTSVDLIHPSTIETRDGKVAVLPWNLYTDDYIYCIRLTDIITLNNCTYELAHFYIKTLLGRKDDELTDDELAIVGSELMTQETSMEYPIYSSKNIH